MFTKPLNFFDLRLADLEKHLSGLGKESYRAKQLYQWVYQKKINNYESMTNLSKTFREELPNYLEFKKLDMVQNLKSKDGTRKFLFKLDSGKTIETVLIPSDKRLTLCVSSEVGCNMACKFCYTAKQKLKQRLTAGEIALQFIQVNEFLPEDEKVTNIVFMGMGEPLDNPEGVFGAIEILNSPWGMNFSRKKVTVSTSGLADRIDLIAKSGARLAVSLNACNDTLRSEIMPINIKYPIKDLINACKDYYAKTKDKITFEYVLLKDVNDSVADARAMKKILSGVPCKINLIPFNEHPGADYERPSFGAVLRFQKVLNDFGFHVLIRRTMGRDIYAACGQLRTLYENHPVRMNTSRTNVPTSEERPHV